MRKVKARLLAPFWVHRLWISTSPIPGHDDLVRYCLFLVCPPGDFATFCGGRGKHGARGKLKDDGDLGNARRDVATVPGGRGACRPGTLSFRVPDSIIEYLYQESAQPHAANTGRQR